LLVYINCYLILKKRKEKKRKEKDVPRTDSSGKETKQEGQAEHHDLILL
jgi:hypothetical protein